MQKTLLDLEGAVLRYVLNRDLVDRRPLRDAINESYQEHWERARDAECVGIEEVLPINLSAGKNVYDLPPQVDTLKGIERMDWGVAPVPLTEVPYKHRYRAIQTGVRGYCVLPGGKSVNLLQLPTADTENGLRLVHLPKTVRMESDTSIPLMPEHTHEAIVAGALMRVRAWAPLKAPKEAEAFAIMAEGRFVKFLEPDGRAQVRSLAPSYTFHLPRPGGI